MRIEDVGFCMLDSYRAEAKARRRFKQGKDRPPRSL
jgi:hypothetical protein